MNEMKNVREKWILIAFWQMCKTLTAKLVWATLAPEFLNLWRIHSCPHLLKFYSLTLLGSFHVFTEKAMAPHSSTLAWKIPWMEEPGRLQSMGSLRVGHDFTFTFHFHALEKEMATCSSVLAWRIPGTGKPGGLPSMGLHRVGHDWSDLAAAAAAAAEARRM